MKKIRENINKYEKITFLISVLFISSSIFLIHIDFEKTKKIYDNIKILDIENLIRIEKQKKIDLIKSLDFKTDNSLIKFVNNKISFNSLNYIPNDLKTIKWNYIFDIKWNSQLRQEANIALQNLSREFFEEFNIKLQIVSAYRSYNYQKVIKNNWCPDNLCAKAWYSEHQSWLAVDIFATTTKKDWQTNLQYIKYYNWFVKNAYKYGFSNTYQRWLEIDWYEIEPWHWRYLWTILAKYLLDNNMTIAEYYNNSLQ